MSKKTTKRNTKRNAASNKENDYYSPELANWYPMASTEDQPNTFTIRERLAGAVIVTITVNPRLSQDNANRIAHLLSCAPDLWQTLQEITPDLLMNQEYSKAFCTAIESLRNATLSHAWPYEWPSIDQDEQEMARKANQSIASGRLRIAPAEKADHLANVRKGLRAGIAMQGGHGGPAGYSCGGVHHPRNNTKR
jgi:hypothetical protein